MARFSIHSKDGRSVRFTGYPTYNGTYLKGSYLEFREIASPAPIAWEVGDYVDYTSDSKTTRNGMRYRLYNIPQPTKQARPGSYGAAFIYSNVQFHSPLKELEIAPFRDIVADDSNIHFSTMNSFSTFEPLAIYDSVTTRWSGILARLQKNADEWFGAGVWEFRLDEDLEDEAPDLFAAISTPRDFSVQGCSILDAMNKCYEVWDNVGWSFAVESGVNVVTFGTPNIIKDSNTTPLMQYGKDNGLTVIQKAQGNLDEFATRLYVYGSQRNMNFRYYNDDTDILNHDSINVVNLMIPKSHWGITGSKRDARKAFITDASLVQKYGVIPKYHYFDGSDDDEIFPSIKDKTIKNVRDGKTALGETDYVPSLSVYTTPSERIDKPKAVVNPTDDGIVNTGAATSEKYDIVLSSGSVLVPEPITPIPVASKSQTQTIFTQTILHGGKVSLSSDFRMFGTVPSGKMYVIRFNLINAGVTIASSSVQSSSSFNVPWPFNDTYELSAGQVKVEVVCTVREDVSGTDTFPYSASTASVKVEWQYATTFSLTLKQIGFDISDRQALGSSGLATIFFNTGMCAGRGFIVKTCDYNSAGDEWRLTLARAYDDSVGMAYPNTSFPITTNDELVLLDLAMPKLYISMAEQELYERGVALLGEVSKVKPVYSPTLDAKVLAESPFAISEGMYMAIKDAQLTDNVTEKILIDTLTIAEGESTIPTYRVNLREEKGRSFKNSIATYSSSSTPFTGVSSQNSGTTGTSDYTSLQNLPKINGATIIGNKSPEQFELASTDYVDREIGKIEELTSFLSSAPLLAYQGGYIWVKHPACMMQGYTICLMVYAKKNSKRKVVGGVAGYRHKKGWCLALGHDSSHGGFTESTGGSSSSVRAIPANEILDYVIQRYCRVPGRTREDMLLMDYSDWQALTLADGDKGFFGDFSEPTFRPRMSKRFGIAIRWNNPAFLPKVVGTLDPTTTEIDGVQRYIYSDVADLKMVFTDYNGIKAKILSFGL